MKFPAAFMKSLGHYQYAYYPNGIFDINVKPKFGDTYIGKGSIDRCLDHLKTKDVTIDELVIVGRNLERFTENESAVNAVQHAVESAFINVLNPTLNKVSGRYDDVWCKAKLVDLYQAWRKTQINVLEEMGKFYDQYKDIIRYNVKVTSSTGLQFTFLAQTVNCIEYLLMITPTIDGYIPTVKIKCHKSKESSAEEIRNQWIENNPDVKYIMDSNLIEVQGLSVDDAIELWMG